MSNRKKAHKKTAGYIALFSFLAGISLAVGIVSAALLLPIAYCERGHWGFGGEWALIFALMAATYYTGNNLIFREAEKGGKH